VFVCVCVVCRGQTDNSQTWVTEGCDQICVAEAVNGGTLTPDIPPLSDETVQGTRSQK
jgi:hypothetical protein